MDVMKTSKKIVERNGGNVSEIYFVACGGSVVDMYVSDFFVRSESAHITSG